MAKTEETAEPRVHKRPGPKPNPRKRRTEVVGVRMHPNQARVLRERAAREGLSVSAYVRRGLGFK
jgi:predicted HicB family RNase H-like nuclease